MGQPLRRSEIQDLAGTVRTWLAAIKTGELIAPTTTVHHLEGALTALEAVLGERGLTIDERLM